MAAVLAMVHVGAKGKTATQMKEAMHLSNFTDDKISAVIGELVKTTKVAVLTDCLSRLNELYCFIFRILRM